MAVNAAKLQVQTWVTERLWWRALKWPIGQALKTGLWMGLLTEKQALLTYSTLLLRGMVAHADAGPLGCHSFNPHEFMSPEWVEVEG